MSFMLKTLKENENEMDAVHVQSNFTVAHQALDKCYT